MMMVAVRRGTGQTPGSMLPGRDAIFVLPCTTTVIGLSLVRPSREAEPTQQARSPDPRLWITRLWRKETL